jgi:enolase
VPSEASRGHFKAVELCDCGQARHFGNGVHKAIESVTGEISAALSGREAYDQRLVDFTLIDLDGTCDKSRLGSTAIVGTSLAVARAAARETRVPLYRHLGGVDAHVLPVPMINVLDGGVHADNNVDFQEFMIVPVGAVSFSEALRWGVETYQCLRQVLHARGLSWCVGQEGGFAPDLSTNEEALEVLSAAIDAAGHVPGQDIALGLDAAASELWREGSYVLAGEGRTMSSAQLVEYWAELVARYPIISIEDGMAEQDWEGWIAHSASIGDRVQIVGDDVFATDARRLALATVSLAKSSSYRCVVSHRSGDVEDPFASDLAVATNCGQIKAGAPARGECAAKYNRLGHIEDDLGAFGEYLGEAAFASAQGRGAS